MRILSFILFVLLFAQPTSAQNSISGKVLDSETGEPVPFVNIGSPKLGVGTVSNSQGEYILKSIKESEQVIFSSIGYEVLELSFQELLKNPDVKLKAKTEVLEEVIISADYYGKDVILGNKLESKGNSIGFAGKTLGTEIGAHIKVRKETLIESAHFTINFTGADSLLFRVNLYDFNKGQVGKKLLNDNVIIKAPQRKGTFDVDLSDYALVVSEDVLLSLEWVHDEHGKGNEGLMFRSKKVASGSNLYTKQTSFATFEKLTERISVAPQLKIGFYLKGVETK